MHRLLQFTLQPIGFVFEFMLISDSGALLSLQYLQLLPPQILLQFLPFFGFMLRRKRNSIGQLHTWFGTLRTTGRTAVLGAEIAFRTAHGGAAGKTNVIRITHFNKIQLNQLFMYLSPLNPFFRRPLPIQKGRLKS